MTRYDERTDFRWPVRVYYEDTDAAGVVYYANYLKFLERARTEWLIALGHSLESLLERYRAAFVVRRVEIDYLRPARLAETLDVTLTLAVQGKARLELDQQVCRGEEPLVSARVELACLDTKSWRPVRIPEPLAHTLEGLR